MSSQTNSLEKPTQQDSPVTNSKAKRLDRLADEAARRAAEREQRYDQEHDIFTK
jgi:hypothetical protein